MPLFSKRHKRALANGELKVELEDTLRVRIWRLMERYNDRVIEDGSYTSYLKQLENDLLDAYGDSHLRVERPDGSYTSELFEYWVYSGRAYGVLDAIEGYERYLPGNWEAFRSELNGILSEEDSNWRLLDSEFVLLDSVFVHQHIIELSQHTLHSVKFEGAAREMLNAQSDLVDREGRGAVHNAGSSFESAMKAALGREDLTASGLTQALTDAGFFDGLPENLRGGFTKQVLASLPWMRNKLGGHGQGRDHQPVPEPYARLALGLAAVLNEFIVTLAIERDASLAQEGMEPSVTVINSAFSTPPSGAGDDDIPF